VTRLFSSWFLIPLLAVTATGASLRAQSAAPPAGFPGKSGEELYRNACAACHGVDGKGNPRSIVGFDIELPDFTDCRFATPEPDLDWSAQIHDGGPVRAFNRRMPAFGDVFSDADVDRLVAYLRGFCTDRAWPRGDLNLPRALVTEKAFPENETVIQMAITRGDEPEVGTEFIYERRLGKRGQMELVVPLDVKEGPLGGWHRGLGDVEFSVKHALVHNIERGSIFSLGLETAFPTGKETSGFGGGVTVFAPFAAFGQVLRSDGFVQIQAGADLPADTAKARKEAFWRGAIGKSFAGGRGFGRSWTPMIELLGARQLVDDEKTQWEVVPQMQVTLSKRQHIMISAGLEIPVTDRNARHIHARSYFLWDWFDGGLFDGWR